MVAGKGDVGPYRSRPTFTHIRPHTTASARPRPPLPLSHATAYSTQTPHQLRTSQVLFEGTPTYPGPDRLWAVVAKHRATILYIAPTAIRALMSHGEAPVRAHDISSLRILGSVGEPINPEAWRWYHTVVGRGKCVGEGVCVVGHVRDWRGISASWLMGAAGTYRHSEGLRREWCPQPPPPIRAQAAHRRHVVADRDGRRHADVAARRHTSEARRRHEGVLWRRRARRARRRRRDGRRRGGFPRRRQGASGAARRDSVGV